MHDKTAIHATAICRCCGAALPPISLATRVDQVPGNEHAKRALEVALAGGLRIALTGVGAGYADALALAQVARRHGLTSYCLLPCPCGNLGDVERSCVCTPAQVAQMQAQRRYQLALRAEIFTLVVTPLATRLDDRRREPDEAILGRIAAAQQRPRPDAGARDAAAESLMRAAVRQLSLTSAAIGQLWAVAAVIAQLAGRDTIGAAHLAEAVQYRPRQQVWPEPVA